MENASKALLMAAEVLISIVVVSALILMFNSLTSYQQSEEKNEEEAAVIAFNNDYEAYDRDDVRGNDLYSLINRVVDYNRRKSSQGTGENEGQYLAYQPMTIKVSFGSPANIKKLTYDDTSRILSTSKTSYTIDSVKNDFADLFNTGGSKSIPKLEEKYSKNALINLTTGISKIFITTDEFNNLDQNEKKQIIYNYNSARGKEELSVEDIYINSSWNKLKENSVIRDDVYKYYEYLQFTKAHFKCLLVKPNEETGRIVKMEFEFTGKIS